MKKFILSLVLAVVLFSGFKNIVYAAGDISLTVKNNGAIVYSGNVALPPAGTVDINDSGGTPHGTNADSVLSILSSADASSTNFNISNLIYYSSFGAFYLKCITVNPATELCDNWQYKVNGDSPMVGMDSEILSGGENVVVYFGSDDSTPADVVRGGGPLVANPPPPPDWPIPKEAPEAPSLPASPVLNNPPVPPSVSLNVPSSVPSGIQVSPDLTKKDAETEKNKPELKTTNKAPRKKKVVIQNEANALSAIITPVNPPAENKPNPPKRAGSQNC